METAGQTGGKDSLRPGVRSREKRFTISKDYSQIGVILETPDS